MNKSVPYIYFLIMLLLPHNSKEEWQDPHDMDFTIDFEPIKLPLKMHGNDKMQSCPSSNSNHELYIKRIINLILNSANLQKEHSTYQGQIKLTIPVDDYNYIVDFTNAKSVDIDMLKKLDAVLSNVFKKNLNEYWLEAGEKILLLLLSESTLHCVSIIGILTFVYFMHKSKYPLWFIFKYVLFLCWIYDAFVTYIHLQEEYDRHNIKILGEQCNKSYTFLEAIQNLMTGENDCKRKLLSPFTVLAEQCAHIVRPLQFVGEGLGGFASGLWGKLPWFVNIILMPVMLIFAAVIFTIFLSFGLQVPIKINILHLINLQFGFKKTTAGIYHTGYQRRITATQQNRRHFREENQRITAGSAS
ncbi:uncharacterized protein LOC109599079 isoform X2 [Aethina tumida]|uniref:uncharacterized protein LOC109599079 isoform X2 n=1 Tax=Aethina tumida TaxID=116153 RepID=UPI00214892BB|nr:uncharacterized protein LOC109599079 isoform X2 [Aethina tumida]